MLWCSGARVAGVARVTLAATGGDTTLAELSGTVSVELLAVDRVADGANAAARRWRSVGPLSSSGSTALGSAPPALLLSLQQHCNILLRPLLVRGLLAILIAHSRPPITPDTHRRPYQHRAPLTQSQQRQFVPYAD